eukprot:scaffold237308_cov35-Tisochrysis_lutea.AAC.1
MAGVRVSRCQRRSSCGHHRCPIRTMSRIQARSRRETTKTGRRSNLKPPPPPFGRYPHILRISV